MKTLVHIAKVMRTDMRQNMVGRRGLEPRTYGLKVRSSTIELATLGSESDTFHSPSPRKPIRSKRRRVSYTEVRSANGPSSHADDAEF